MPPLQKDLNFVSIFNVSNMMSYRISSPFFSQMFSILSPMDHIDEIYGISKYLITVLCHQL